jgi:hypothetical protein
VKAGGWYAAFERINYLYLPYFDVPIAEKLFFNGEKARTYFSTMNDYPGLFSSVEAYFGNINTFQLCTELGIQV